MSAALAKHAPARPRAGPTADGTTAFPKGRTIMRSITRLGMTLGALAVLATLPAASFAQTPSAPGAADRAARTIIVTGQGSVDATPDQARITMGVEAVRPTAQAAQNAANTVMDQIVRQVTALGIPKEQIRTSSLDLTPQRKPGSDNNPITGYVATNRVTVVVDDLRLTGRVVDAAVGAGANEVDSLSFGLKDPSAYRARALRLAVQDAQATAAALASAAAVGPIHLVRVEELGSSAPPRLMIAAPAQAMTTVLPGMVTVTASVRAVYAF